MLENQYLTPMMINDVVSLDSRGFSHKELEWIGDIMNDDIYPSNNETGAYPSSNFIDNVHKSCSSVSTLRKSMSAPLTMPSQQRFKNIKSGVKVDPLLASGTGNKSTTAVSCKRRRRLIKASSEGEQFKIDLQYNKGRWKPYEISMLIHVAQLNIENGALSSICDICSLSGLQRPRRAVDKQLKRLLKYDTWLKRDIESTKKRIAEFYSDFGNCGLTNEQVERIEKTNCDYLRHLYSRQKRLSNYHSCELPCV